MMATSFKVTHLFSILIIISQAYNFHLTPSLQRVHTAYVFATNCFTSMIHIKLKSAVQPHKFSFSTVQYFD